jgi:hypothetical protein
MRNFSTKTEVLRNRRKPKPARVAADGSLKEQKKVKARKGGDGRKPEETEGSGNSQEWKPTEVSEGRGHLRLARVEDDRSAGEQRKLEARKGGKGPKFHRTEGVGSSSERKAGKNPQGI